MDISSDLKHIILTDDDFKFDNINKTEPGTPEESFITDIVYKRHAGIMYELAKNSANITDMTGTNACFGCAFMDDDFACHQMRQVDFNIGCRIYNGIWKKVQKHKKRSSPVGVSTTPNQVSNSCKSATALDKENRIGD